MSTSAMIAAPLLPQAAKVVPSRFHGLRLTKKERELLAILMQNPGKCISREILLRTIWKYSDGAKTRTVDVHVQRLRRKMGSEAAAAIKTIVRSGYCWLPDQEQHQ